jgi:hypothetical protein
MRHRLKGTTVTTNQLINRLATELEPIDPGRLSGMLLIFGPRHLGTTQRSAD